MGLPQTVSNRYSVEQYLRLESEAVDRHEYCDGEILGMAGGSPAHSLIIANFIREAGTKLKGKPCRIYDSNLRVRIPRRTLYTYPDASILCEAPQLDPQDRSGQTVMNPRVIVEVLSPSTEGYDRGEKFERYRWLDSLREYVLVSQATPRIETFVRQEEGSWLFRSWAGVESSARLRTVETDLPLAEVYAGVTFAPEEEAQDEPPPS